FVSSFHGATLSVFDINTRKRLKAIAFGPDAKLIKTRLPQPLNAKAYPPGEAIVANGKVFVSVIFTDYVDVLDLQTLALIKRLPIGGEGYMTASADGKTVYFASSKKNEFYIVDSTTFEHKTVAYPADG